MADAGCTNWQQTLPRHHSQYTGSHILVTMLPPPAALFRPKRLNWFVQYTKPGCNAQIKYHEILGDSKNPSPSSQYIWKGPPWSRQEKCALNLIHCCVKTGIAHKAIIANWTENSLDILFIKKRVKLTVHATITKNDNPCAPSFLGDFDLGL